MTIQLSVALINARLDAIETTIGTGPTLEMRTGAPPATCATADSGTVVATITLPSDWMANASDGTKDKLGTWSDASADNAGVVAHFRIKKGGVCHMQGRVGTSGTDMIVDKTSVSAGEAFTISAFTLLGDTEE